MIRSLTAKSKVETYCHEVTSGAIPVCKVVKQAVNKYLDEIERIGDADWPFHFEPDSAELACAFFPMLLRHSVGQWAGQPFELSPWQAFIVWNIFGWKRKDGTRRFRRVFLSVARKNGKSTFCAGLAIQLAAADDEPGAQIFIGATKLDQARIIHQESERMMRKSPHLFKHSTIHKDNIAFSATNSFVRPLGSDKPFDGLNPHGAFFDELHAWREHHRSFFDTMVTGSGSRTQPLQVIITTAGDEKSQIYHEEANYSRGVVSGDIIDPSLFALIYELDQDDEPFNADFDPGILMKSNPGYGVSVMPEYLNQQLTEARNKPQAKNRFVRYHGNRCVSSVEDSISAELWDSISGQLSDWRKADGVAAGVDIGGRDDLAAYALTAKFKIGQDSEDRPLYREETKSTCFIAEDTKRDLTAEPFRTWIEQGKLIVSKFVITELKERLIEDCQAFGAEFVAYDPYQATQLAEELELEGLRPIKMPQNHGHFNETIAEYHQQVTEGLFKPDVNDTLLRWCALNMSINRDRRDRMMPDKKASKEKIDAAVAMLMSKRAVKLTLPPMVGSLVL